MTETIGPPEAPGTPSARFFHAVHGLRGCAVLLVMLFHFTIEAGPRHTLAARAMTKALSGGWVGVDLFFVISGFLITGILVDSVGAKNYFRAFYMRRALRILPLYYAVLAAAFLSPLWMAPAVAAQYRTSFGDQAWYWLNLQNLHPLHNQNQMYGYVVHLWSLAIEEQFYLVWPLALLLVPRQRRVLLCLVCIVGALVVRLVGLWTLPDRDWLYFLTPARIDGLATGALIAVLSREPRGLEPLRRLVRPVVVCSVLFFLVTMARYRWLDPRSTAMLTVGYLVLAMFFGALLVHALLSARGRFASALSSPLLAFFARYSYALYVLHWPLVMFGHKAGVTDFVFRHIPWELAALVAYSLLMTAVSSAVALLSWYLWESRFLALKDHFVARLPAAARVAGQPPLPETPPNAHTEAGSDVGVPA